MAVDSGKAASPAVSAVKSDSSKPIGTKPDSARASAAKQPDSAKGVTSVLPGSVGSTTASRGPGADSASADSVALDSAKNFKAKKRSRIVRETTVNSIDELKGRYRSPKKALFMSLILPGLGQAYVGHSWMNYSRGAFYFLTDVALLSGWHYYVGTKQDREVAKYKKFADTYWRQSRYENQILLQAVPGATEKLGGRNNHRETYCASVQDVGTPTGTNLLNGCVDPSGSSQNYGDFQREYNDQNWSIDSISNRRGQFVNPQQFYELLGKEVEFVTGWDDAGNISYADSSFFKVTPDGTKITGDAGLPITEHQQKYISLRAQANEYARMQAYFLGGMVVNHIISALDAALAARYHNKGLYQTETSWYDRVRLDGGLAWVDFQPAPTVNARVSF